MYIYIYTFIDNPNDKSSSGKRHGSEIQAKTIGV